MSRKGFVFHFILVLGLVGSSASAAHLQKNPKSTQGRDSSHWTDQWYLGIGTGFSWPIQGWNPNYYLGGGGRIFIGDRFDRDWALQFNIDQWYWTGGGFTSNDLRFVPELKWIGEGKG